MSDSAKRIYDDLARQLADAVTPETLVPAPAQGPSIQLAWNNYYGSWSDGGWNKLLRLLG